MEEEERAKPSKLWLFFNLLPKWQNFSLKAQITASVLVIMAVRHPDYGMSDCPEPSPELHGERFSSSEMQI